MKKELSFVYIASDGKKFIEKIDAIEYEKMNLNVKGILKENINTNGSWLNKCFYLNMKEIWVRYFLV